MEAFIVIPCLNEQEGLAATCLSLGFGCGRRPTGRLVLVDNGSSDRTFAVMEQIRDASPFGCVLVVREPRRGYVPARRAGVAVVHACVQAGRIPLDQALILQADADTIYLEGYVDAMLRACSDGRGQLLEGCAVASREFNAQYPAFTQLCRDIDLGMERWSAPEDDQVVVDDKVSGLSLADYIAWGEHREEVDSRGRQIHAETTRLFLRAKCTGAVTRRRRVEDAMALPSRRKLFAQAPAYFAASGFPRNCEWIASWSHTADATVFLAAPTRSAWLDRLVRSRQRHQLALFGLLPTLFQIEARVPAKLLQLSMSLRQGLKNAPPGYVLERVLSLADEEGGAFDALLGAGSVLDDGSWMLATR